jgi:DNA-directed RNA polymerase specialized sigma24 family protein
LSQATNEYEPGSATDFERLYRDSYWKVVATMTGVLGGDQGLAEDCAQDAFERAFRAWRRWRPDAPAEAWVHRIAISNSALSEKRRQKRREVGELVRRLGRLKTQEAAIVILRHHHGYSNREIATALEVPESTISSGLVSAKAKLRKLLGNSGELVTASVSDVVTVRTR